MKKLLYLIILIPSILQAYDAPYIIRNIQEGKDKFKAYATDENFYDIYGRLSLMVDNYSNQSIAGNKTFSNITVSSLTATNLIVTHSTITNITSTNANITNLTATNITTGGKTWQVIYSTVIVTATGLITVPVSGDTDIYWRISWDIVNGYAGAVAYGLNVNTTTTASDWGWEGLNANGTTIAAGRSVAGSANGFPIGTGVTSANANFVRGRAECRPKSGKKRMFEWTNTNTVFAAGANYVNDIQFGSACYAQTDAITQLRFMADQATGYGAGTFIMIEALR